MEKETDTQTNEYEQPWENIYNELIVTWTILGARAAIG
jgi:hypothetical protein